MAVHNPTVFLYFQQSSIPDSFFLAGSCCCFDTGDLVREGLRKRKKGNRCFQEMDGIQRKIFGSQSIKLDGFNDSIYSCLNCFVFVFVCIGHVSWRFRLHPDGAQLRSVHGHRATRSVICKWPKVQSGHRLSFGHLGDFFDTGHPGRHVFPFDEGQRLQDSGWRKGNGRQRDHHRAHV